MNKEQKEQFNFLMKYAKLRTYEVMFTLEERVKIKEYRKLKQEIVRFEKKSKEKYNNERRKMLKVRGFGEFTSDNNVQNERWILEESK